MKKKKLSTIPFVIYFYVKVYIVWKSFDAYVIPKDFKHSIVKLTKYAFGLKKKKGTNQNDGQTFMMNESMNNPCLSSFI